jgi:hypothetical protein
MKADYTDFYAMVGLQEDKVLAIVKKLINNFKEDRKKIIGGIDGMEKTDFERFKNYFLQYLDEYHKVVSSPKAGKIEKLIHKLRTNRESMTQNEKLELAKLLGNVGNQRMTYNDEDVEKLMDTIVKFQETTTSSIPST